MTVHFQPGSFSARPFPVADDFFPPLFLSESRLASLRAEAAAAINKTLGKCLEYERSRGTYLVKFPPWKLHAEHNGLVEYKRGYRRHPTITASRVFGTIEGNYLDVARFFKAETREDCFNVHRALFAPTVDAAVVHTIPRLQNSATHESIQWVACEPLSLRCHMDSCHYEAVGVGVDCQGKPYAYRVILPAEFREVPDLFSTKRTVRVQSKSVMILRPSSRSSNESEIFMSIQNDFKGVPVSASLFREFLVGLQTIGQVLEGKQTVYKLRGDRWVEKKIDDSQCGVCSRSFHLLRARTSCSRCQEAVCRKCLVKEAEVFETKAAKHSSAKLCTSCVVHVRKQLPTKLVTPVLGDSTPSILSDDAETCVWSGRRSSLDDWLSSPVNSKRSTKAKSRRRLQTATSLEDETWSRTDSWASDVSHYYPDSPVADLTSDEYEQTVPYLFDDDDDDNAILEERRSVELTLDTSDMVRVREGSETYHSSGMLAAINVSLQEQCELLRQMHRFATRRKEMSAY